MIEEGKEWEAHTKSKGHKNRAGREHHLERIRKLKEGAAERRARLKADTEKVAIK